MFWDCAGIQTNVLKNLYSETTRTRTCTEMMCYDECFQLSRSVACVTITVRDEEIVRV